MEISNQKILIVDDESNIRQILKKYFLAQGYTVILAANGEWALSLFKREQPDLIILDIILSRIDGYDVCNKLRQESKVPIIILTALSSISNRILGLELGADDYIIKPFSPKELEVRINSVLRRDKQNFKLKISDNQNIIYVDQLKIDLGKRQIFKKDKRIKLTEIEFNLLELLVIRAGEKLSRTFILSNVWGYVPERYTDTRVVDVHISRLRAKLENDSSNPDLILTERQIGYMFQKFYVKNVQK